MKALVWVVAALVGLGLRPAAQMDGTSRERVRTMLRHAYENVQKHYYDETFHGIDWDARYRSFDEKVKAAASLNAGMTIVADFLNGLADSHTFFVPPARPYDFDYGFRYPAYGNRVFVTQIRPGSDAAAKLNLGDEILLVNDAPVDRDSATRVRYLHDVLSPQPGLVLAVADPRGARREVRITTSTRQRKRQLDLTTFNSEDLWQLIRRGDDLAEDSSQRYVEMGNVMVWRMPNFIIGEKDVDRMFDIARKHEFLVLDLRGNPGGRVTTLLRMVGAVFPNDLPVATLVSRTPQTPLVAKASPGRTYLGEITVLVDAESASAAELFARVIQLEGRGNVVGDRTSGRVMQSLGHAESQGLETVISYSFSITNADVLMRDGNSLERVGVTPAVMVLPSAQDLAAKRDVALAKAMELAGLRIDPVKAGEMFPYKWRPF